MARFRVTIGDDVVGICRIEGLAMMDGERRPVVRLERALSGSRLLFDWHKKGCACDLLIEQLDAACQRTIVGFHLDHATPVAWHAPSWDSLTDEVAVEAVEVVYEELRWVSHEGDTP